MDRAEVKSVIARSIAVVTERNKQSGQDGTIRQRKEIIAYLDRRDLDLLILDERRRQDNLTKAIDGIRTETRRAPFCPDRGSPWR